MPGGAPTWSPAWPRCTPPRSRTSARSPISDMAMKLQAARLLTYWAAARADAGRRADLESGLAKVYASEVAYECAFAAMQVHGGYGYSKDFTVERLYRDAPLMVIGEGTNDILRSVIAESLVAGRGVIG